MAGLEPARAFYGVSIGSVATVDCEGRTIWIVHAHRGGGKRFVVRADEKLTALLFRSSLWHAEVIRRRLPSDRDLLLF
jgi:hypothetical protein